MEAPRRMLVVRGGAIGDFVLTLPVLAALRGAFPAAGLALLAGRECGELAVAGGLADESRALEGREWAEFFVENGGCDKRACEWLAGVDLVVSLLHDPDGVFQRSICAATGARHLAGCHRPVEGSGQSAAVSLLEALDPLGITNDADAVPRLDMKAPKGNRLAMHPGSGSASKNWPEENWAAFLALWLAETDSDILIVGGEAETDRVRRLSAPLPVARHQVLLHAPLTEVARALGGCRAFVGHDSGITHLAAAVGLPGVALWAHTDATVWRPPGGAMQVLPQPVSPIEVLERVATFFK